MQLVLEWEMGWGWGHWVSIKGGSHLQSEDPILFFQLTVANEGWIICCIRRE
jgi:hypothetical protein